MAITNDDVKRIAYKLAEEIIADYGWLDKSLLENRMQNTTGIRPAITIQPDGAMRVDSFKQVLQGNVNIGAIEADLDYRRSLRSKSEEELAAEALAVKGDPGRSNVATREVTDRKSPYVSAFIAVTRGLSIDDREMKIREIILAGPESAIRIEREVEARKKADQKRTWAEKHPDVVLPADTEIDDEIDTGDEEEDEEDEDHPEPEEWIYDANDANNPWYLIWSGGNSLNVISMIFPSKKAGLEYLVPIIGVPVSEDENDVSWDFDAEKASNAKIAKLFTNWYFGCGGPSSPSLVRAKFGKPLVGFDLD